MQPKTEVVCRKPEQALPADGFAYAMTRAQAKGQMLPEELPGWLGDTILNTQWRAIFKGGFKGHVGQTACLVGTDGTLHVLFGVEMPEKQGWRPWDKDPEVLAGRGFAYAVRAARKHGVKHLCCVSGETDGLLGYYGLSANYEFSQPGEPEAVKPEDSQEEGSGKPLGKISLPMEESAASVAAGRARNLARDWMNLTFNHCSTMQMAELARDSFIASGGNPDHVHIYDELWMREQGFDLTLSVARGSNQTMNPPRIMVLEWLGKPGMPDKTDVVLVGKGVVHDKGGLNLKTDSGDMHMDKGGACTVLAAMCAIAELKPKVNVRCVVFLVENAIGPDCSTTGDIIYSRLLEKKVRINNTDAEGRLGLAECVAYAKKTWNPSMGIDVSTLTGLQAAFSPGASTVFGTDLQLALAFYEEGVSVGDRLTIGWPDYDCQQDMEKHGGVGADTGTIGTRKMGTVSAGGAVIAAEFVLQSVTDVPWLHIDMAGAMERGKDDGEFAEGADTPNIVSILQWIVFVMPETQNRE